MEILVPLINWIVVYILLKTFFKKYIFKSKNPYYQLSIHMLILFNFIKDIIIFLLSCLIFYNGLQTESLFPNTFFNLINWSLIFILSKSIFELFGCFMIKNFSNKFPHLVQYFVEFVNNFTVEKSLIRTLFSIPWVILTYLFYRYT
jgi:hypothetical protein